MDRMTGEPTVTDLTLRRATIDDADALFALITSHAKEGHLLPREIEELRRHAARFVVCDVGGELHACAELAPLSAKVAEVRSLVVSKTFRRVGLAARLVNELRGRAVAAGFDKLCAFTHDARFFVRQNFSIVPHLWLPEKISTDCVGCPLFRRCEQYAVVMPLHEVVRFAAPATVHRMSVA
jgi:N-acetylglutamate synthase-like GNAT family acetyltransferase